MIGFLRWVGLGGLTVTSAIALVGGRIQAANTGAAWPSLAHPLGVDAMGRDFLRVLSAGTLDFALPGLAAVLALSAALALQCWTQLRRPPLGAERRGPISSIWLTLAAPPRLLLVMIGMLFLDEPSPWVAATIVTALYLPVALDECRTRLGALREQQILAGAIGHGVSRLRLVLRHLLAGHLRPAMERHVLTLFGQVAFTQLALAYVFGASAVTSGLGVSLGMEFRRLVARLPSRAGTFCDPGLVCEPHVAVFHSVLLVGLCLVFLGGLQRSTRPAEAAVGR